MMPARPRPYRVFISYSHDDREKFEEVCAALRRVGVQPWSDADLAVGSNFSEQIQTNISHSHLFVPILTEQSHARGWVLTKTREVLPIGVMSISGFRELPFEHA